MDPDKGLMNPGTLGKEYSYPTPAEVDYYVGKGMNAIRLPFAWERLQRSLLGDLNAVDLNAIRDFVSYATGKGAYVILDPHNYARYAGKLLGNGLSAREFADLWRRLAAEFKGNQQVLFGLMNEPHNMDTSDWLAGTNAAIAAIRGEGAHNLILVPGNSWTGAWSWSGNDNGTVMANVADSENHFAYEVHQYLDTWSSGTEPKCMSATIGSERLSSFTQWLADHHARGFLGEFQGEGDQDICKQAIDDMLAHIDQHQDLWLGWTYWAGGPWWPDSNALLEPKNWQDRPMMPILAKHF